MLSGSIHTIQCAENTQSSQSQHNPHKKRRATIVPSSVGSSSTPTPSQSKWLFVQESGQENEIDLRKKSTKSTQTPTNHEEALHHAFKQALLGLNINQQDSPSTSRVLFVQESGQSFSPTPTNTGNIPQRADSRTTKDLITQHSMQSKNTISTTSQENDLLEAVKISSFLSCFLGAYIERYIQNIAARGSFKSLEASLSDMGIHFLLGASTSLPTKTVLMLEAYITKMNLMNESHRILHILSSLSRENSSAFATSAQNMLQRIDHVLYTFSEFDRVYAQTFPRQNIVDPITIADVREIILSLIQLHAQITQNLQDIVLEQSKTPNMDHNSIVQKIQESGFLTIFFSILSKHATDVAREKKLTNDTDLLHTLMRISHLDITLLGREITDHEVRHIKHLPYTRTDSEARELMHFDRNHVYYNLIREGLQNQSGKRHYNDAVLSILQTCIAHADQAAHEQKDIQNTLKMFANTRIQTEASQVLAQARSSTQQIQPTQGQEFYIDSFFDAELLARFDFANTAIQEHRAEIPQNSAYLPTQGQALDTESFIDSFFN